jgi:hypothetical protein
MVRWFDAANAFLVANCTFVQPRTSRVRSPTGSGTLTYRRHGRWGLKSCRANAAGLTAAGANCMLTLQIAKHSIYLTLGIW